MTGPSGSKLEPRSIVGRLVAYKDSSNMFGIYSATMYKVDTVWRVKFNASSYTSGDVHTPPLRGDGADTPPTIIHELRPVTPTRTIRPTTSYMHRTLSGSYAETPVQSRHPLRIEVSSAHTNMQEYLKVSAQELKSGRDSVTTNTIACPSTPRRNTCTAKPSPHKISKPAQFDEVSETTKLNYRSWHKRELQQTPRYYEHGSARLVVLPTMYEQPMASLDADSWQSGMLEEY